jgi:hypothetical protein
MWNSHPSSAVAQERLQRSLGFLLLSVIWSCWFERRHKRPTRPSMVIQFRFDMQRRASSALSRMQIVVGAIGRTIGERQINLRPTQPEAGLPNR